ncbi:MAG: BTAD domain-containing putative transcriptional regulator [Anaerolineaceae bacterium]
MSNLSSIILSQVTPPAQRSNILPRERVTRLLEDSLNYPITILNAGTGYGKSTSLLSFIEGLDIPVFWFSVSSSDRDPALFLNSLYTAFNQRGMNLGADALRVLQIPDSEPTEGLIALINSVAANIPDQCLLVIDDFQYLRQSSEIMNLMDWFIEHLPRSLHVILSTRTAPDFASIHRWRAKDTILELGKNELTFLPDEIEDLFRSQYQVELSPEEVEQLYQRTEGWAIGLQMVWQSIKGQTAATIRQVLEDDRESRTNLFAYLAEEVLENLNPVQQDFLIKTSVLAILDVESCDFLLDSQNSFEILNDLYRSGLFVEQMRPGVYRYHHMFREFLQSRLSKNPELERDLNRKIASYYSAHQYWERAIGHLLAVGDYALINHILEDVGEKMIQAGRYESIRYWIKRFPEAERALYPYINYLMGEMNRYSGNFELALEDYRTAQRLYLANKNNWGVSLALRGQAQVYLDTIRPINANQLLKRALSLLDPLESRNEVSELLTQIAENQVNQGETANAAESLRRARELAGEDRINNSFIEARLLLRTGRITEGIRLLESLELGVEAERFSRPQRFHREASLLLSLFYSFCGDLEKSAESARKGIEIGKHLRSNFVRSVGYMRLGHAQQLAQGFNQDQANFQEVMESYEESMRNVNIVRIHVEPLWGICRLLGFSGKVEEARKVANQALSIANSAGDEWIAMLVRLSMGASLALSGNYEAANQELTVAESVATRVGDTLASTAAEIWLAYSAFHQGFQSSLWLYLEQGLSGVRQYDYQFLLTKPTMLGSDEPADFIPLLIEARKQSIHTELTDQLLSELGADGLSYHPGYGLRIKTLGGFSLWRGRNAVNQQDWKREKARQLLQVLVVNHRKWLSRDQITLILWPDADQVTAANNFKVTLSTLNQDLEPSRPAGKSPFFILRHNDQYTLNPDADIYIDVEAFEHLSRADDQNSLERAAKLYQGRYFENEMVQEYCVAEEQYYHEIYLRTMDVLIERAMQQNDLESALNHTRTLLARDPLWEPAYRRLMVIYHRMGNQSMVQQTFKQCQQVMSRQIGSSVSAETQALLEELLNSG